MFKKIQDIGKISYISLWRYIKDNELSDGDIIQLNVEDYNELINSGLFSDVSYLKEPCYIDEVLIEPAEIKKERILSIALLNPPQPISKDISPRFSIIYRCRFCGNIVAEDGNLLIAKTRNQMIKTIEKFKNIKMVSVAGACCPNGNN